MVSTPSRYSSSLPVAGPGLLAEIDDRQAPTRTVLRVTGELDLATAEVLCRAISRAAADCQQLELDLSCVTFCDVVGAATIERAQQQLQARGCQLTLHGIDRSLHLLLAVDGLFDGLRPCARWDGHRG
jgi:anti-anti-sigma factor